MCLNIWPVNHKYQLNTGSSVIVTLIFHLSIFGRELLSVSGALVITWTPWASLVIIRSIIRDESFLEKTNGIYNFSYFFTYINSTVNPLCYALASRTFASSFYKIICCKCRHFKQRSISLNSLREL